MKYFKQIVTAILFMSMSLPGLFAQTKPAAGGDSIRIVEILPGARKLEYRKIDSLTELQILVGNVKLKQGTTLFFCDSCVINNFQHTFEAFGNIHIEDDTTDVYSNYLRYLTDKRVAYLTGNVRLTDGKGTLTTNELEYDVNTGIGIYRKGGKVVNKKTVLTSEEGYYYSDIKDVYFKKNVQLKDPSFRLSSDSLLYNTQTETARFIAETFITDTSNRTIITKEGFYNIKTGKAEFGQNPVINDGAVRITALRIALDDSTGISQAEGNAVVVDTAQGTTILAGVIFRNNKTQSLLATRKPLMIIKQDQDSIYIAADTLFSARLTDLYGPTDSVIVDTLKKVTTVSANDKDSTNRYFEALRNVRIFSDSLQAASDSLFYSFKDSTFRLYQDPVIWANKSQITGDTIYLFTKNKKADRMQVFENSLLVNEVQPQIFNQIAATRMDGYFIDGSIDSVRARGFAESIYFLQEEDSSFSGINETTSDILDIYFKDQELQKVVFRSAVSGTLWPIRQKNPGEMRLKNFIWLEDRRPKTKFELFE
jgi:lipopolysaccharide export system protein LptA